MKMDKIVKEDENFIWYETKYGIGYVASKHAYFHFEQLHDDAAKLKEEIKRLKENS